MTIDTSAGATFSDFSLAPAVLQAIGKVGYETPSPVQKAAIAPLLEGSDLLATAQTGTGKTAAFALPLLSRLNLEHNAPQLLVLAPTRELAIQVSEAFKTYASEMRGFRALAIYGGQSMHTQLQALKRGVHVVVGTPGRTMDHLRRKSLKLDKLQSVVLDEADEMLRMGFIDDVEWILEHTPKNKQVALFSATMPKPIRKIAEQYLQNPTEIHIQPDKTSVSNIEQLYWPINRTRKIDALIRLLEAEPVDGAVVFVRTKSQTVEVADKLLLAGINAAPINGDMNQTLRERTIEKLKSSQINVLVATDVAARGIDVTRVSHVFNFDMPFDSDVYTHRIGRTGRAGRKGKAILFVTQREKRLLRSLEKATSSEISQIELPSPAQIRKLRIEQFKKDLIDIDTSELPELFQQVASEILQESDQPIEKIAAALVYLAQKSRPFYSPGKKESGHTSSANSTSNSDNTDNTEGREKKGKRRKEEKSPRKTRKSEPVFDDDGKEVAMETFKIHVGHKDDVSPGHIVGAIANEADISSQYIGHISIQETYSTVDLPKGMPEEVYNHLKKVRVKNRKLGIERMSAGRSSGKSSGEKAINKNKRKASKKPKQRKREG